MNGIGDVAGMATPLVQLLKLARLVVLARYLDFKKGVISCHIKHKAFQYYHKLQILLLFNRRLIRCCYKSEYYGRNLLQLHNKLICNYRSSIRKALKYLLLRCRMEHQFQN